MVFFLKGDPMGGQHGISGTNTESEIPPHLHYIVSGEITPDATGEYLLKGMYGGQKYFKNIEKGFFLYYGGGEIEAWFIGKTLGKTDPPFWVRFIAEIVGEYDPAPSYEGQAFVNSIVS